MQKPPFNVKKTLKSLKTLKYLKQYGAKKTRGPKVARSVAIVLSFNLSELQPHGYRCRD